VERTFMVTIRVYGDGFKTSLSKEARLRLNGNAALSVTDVKDILHELLRCLLGSLSDTEINEAVNPKTEE